MRQTCFLKLKEILKRQWMKENIIIAVLELTHTEIVDSVDDSYGHVALHYMSFWLKKWFVIIA